MIRKTFITSLQYLFLVLLPVLFSVQASAQNHSVSGLVIDAEKEPIVGASVLVSSSKQGTFTDGMGMFHLTNLKKGDELSISFIGFETRNVVYNGEKSLKIILETDATLLDDVVVIGYGTERKVDITGSVVSVAKDVTEDRIVMSLADALKGKAAGVLVSSQDGAPGSTAKINIRGNTSLQGSSEALIIVDGVVGAMVSPNEIETIDILKDAASTAIYGSRGANGVILITTKKGTKGKANINLSAIVGAQQIARKMPLMTSDQWIDKVYCAGMGYIKSADFDPSTANPSNTLYLTDPEGNIYHIAKDHGMTPYYYHNDPNLIIHNTDWQGAMMQNALVQDYRMDVSGAGENNNYSVMFGYKKQDGIFRKSNFDEYTFRANFQQRIMKKLLMTLSVAYSDRGRNGYNSGLNGILWNVINTPSLKPKDFDNQFVLPTDQSMVSFDTNPLTLTDLITQKHRSTNNVYNVVLDYDIIDGLRLHLSGSYTKDSNRFEQFLPKVTTIGNSAAANGSATTTTGNAAYLGSENFMQYSHTFAQKHKLDAMLGCSFNQARWEDFAMTNNSYDLEDLGYHGMGEGTKPMIPRLSGGQTRMASYFGRLNYNYGDRYLLKFTMRADGASVFAKNNKWGYFPSAAAAWRISEEKWMKNQHVVDNLKLRASWGITGKQAAGAYSSLKTLQSVKTSMDSENLTSGTLIGDIGNADLKWEKTAEVNVGLDLSIFKGRLSLTTDYYNRLTTDLLYRDPIPQYTGFASQMRNIGSLRNSGVELNLHAVPVSLRNFSWDMNFNISHNNSRLLSLGVRDWQTLPLGWIGQERSAYIKVGERLDNFYGYKSEGIWQSQAEIDNAIASGALTEQYGGTLRPGFVKVQDFNKDGYISPEDRQIIGHGAPDFTGGFTNTFSLYGFTLNLTLQFSYGGEIMMASYYNMTNPMNNDNGLAEFADRWRPELRYYDPSTGTAGDIFMEGNPDGYLPFAATTTTEDAYDYWIKDGSFLRIADLTLSYDLPEKWVSKMRMKNVKIYFTVNNLYTFTNYPGFDPEVNTSAGAANFLCPGLDFVSYPRSRSFSAGINLSF